MQKHADEERMLVEKKMEREKKRKRDNWKKVKSFKQLESYKRKYIIYYYILYIKNVYYILCYIVHLCPCGVDEP